ncbi:MAG: heme-copper oxidase subunit III [Gemmatimonadetes bacterium]|nr:heme-copper oxidase subunit III [Gemmatimonadota bacterium]
MSHAATHTIEHAEEGLGVYTQKLGMWVFLCSEVMFFTALIGSYIILRWGSAESWPVPAETLNIPVTALNTFILICSSVSMVKAYAAAVHDDQRGLKRWLLTTVLGGATFVGVQAYEYIHLIGKGFLPSSGLFGSTFYTMTGFHGFHVTCGVISMAYCTLRAFRGKYAGGNFHGIETVGLYWHFVDLVWIILFTIVYLF